jgi:hypothetical protein
MGLGSHESYLSFMRRHENVHGENWHNGHRSDFFIPVLGSFPATEVNTLYTTRDEFHT